VTVTLNEAAISRFFSDPSGPLAQDIERRAQNVTNLARQNAQLIIESFPVSSMIGYRMEQGPDGIQAVIGVTEDGRMARYLDEKEQRERIWLTPALRDGFDL